MPNLKNLFYFRELPTDGPFCNREEEQKELASHAQSLANVVLYSPRRLGKTSLIKRVQKNLAGEGAVAIYTHFYGVTSVEDVAARLAKAVFKVTHKRESLFNKAVRVLKSFRPTMVMLPDEEKGFSINVQIASGGMSGMELLEDVMESLGQFIQDTKDLVYIVFDEFQEITELPDVIKIEGIMRQHIQQHQAAYTFIGSRRRVLLGIFNEKQRPFFKSAINYELGPLPRAEFAEFIVDLFTSGGKSCELSVAGHLVDEVQCFPYYAQKLAYFVFERASQEVRLEDVRKGFNFLLKDESPSFEGILLGLPPQQIALLRALASEPTTSIFSQQYMHRHRLSSVGGTQGAKKRLSSLDLIEQDKKKVWKVVDPVMARWLEENISER
jgi:hypothetical protein